MEQRIVVLDIETNMSEKNRIIWMCVTKDLITKEIKIWNQANGLWEYLKDFTKIVMHNGISFDAYLLNRLWKTKISLTKVIDTLVISRLLNPSRENGHSLGAWGKILTLGRNEETGKMDYPALWEESRGRKQEYQGECFDYPVMHIMTDYCVQDVNLTERLYYHLIYDIEESKFSEQSIELEHKVQAIVSTQERNGFLLDIPYAMSLLAEIKSKMSNIVDDMQIRFPPVVYERISEKTGKKLADGVDVFNPGSRKQIADRLMKLGWKPDKTTEKGAIIVDESTLVTCDLPEAKIVLEYMMLQKRSAQLESWLEAAGDDGRVHGKIITNGAVTGRMTHHSPNMAQVPNSGSIYGIECRKCWTVAKGYVQVGADASGLELRMLAHYMKDADYTNEVVNGDIHTKNQTAAGLPTRNNAKTFIYAFLYGAGAAKIGSVVGGGAKEGQKLIDSFLKATPALAKLKETVARLAQKGTLLGLDGRKIIVRSEHAALNSLLQSAGAIVMKQALIILDQKIRINKWDAKFIANVHDEWQLEVKEGQEHLVGVAAKESIKEAGEHFKMRCPLDGEYKTGSNWSECH